MWNFSSSFQSHSDSRKPLLFSYPKVFQISLLQFRNCSGSFMPQSQGIGEHESASRQKITAGRKAICGTKTLRKLFDYFIVFIQSILLERVGPHPWVENGRSRGQIQWYFFSPMGDKHKRKIIILIIYYLRTDESNSNE